MAMVIPRARSSGALSIESKARNSASPRSASTLVIAAVRVVLPWSMCPIVPTFTCGLVRSNFFLAMLALSLTSYLGRDFLSHVARNLVVLRELHRVAGATLRHRAQVGRVAEHALERDQRAHDLVRVARLDADDLAASGAEVAHHVAEPVLRRGDLDAHDRLEQDRARPADRVLDRH